MSFPELQGALITRDAHEALTVLKKLVDAAEEKIRLAERETAAIAIGHSRDDNPLKTLRDIAEAFETPKLDAVISTFREKVQNAVEWHLRFQI